jgi:hypothetical protein
VHVAGSRFWRGRAGRVLVLLALLASATNMAMGIAGSAGPRTGAGPAAIVVAGVAGVAGVAAPTITSDQPGGQNEQRSGSPFRIIHKARGVVTPHVVLAVPVTGVAGPAGAPTHALGDTVAVPGAPPVSANPHRGPPPPVDAPSPHRRTPTGR